MSTWKALSQLTSISTLLKQIQERFKPIAFPSGIYTVTHLRAVGFVYTCDEDTAGCDCCGLEVSGWTAEMNPFSIHAERSPYCTFICTLKTSVPLSTTAIPPNTSVPNQRQNIIERHSIESVDVERSSNCFPESDLLKRVRKRTFSHWPHDSALPEEQMVKAGFYQCNVGHAEIQDRVICIHCNLICQKWTPYADDPCEVHETLSPNCVFVKAKLARPPTSSGVITNNHSSTSTDPEPSPPNEIAFTAACNPSYAESSKRHASFATWPNENLPSVDDLVRAGCLYTGTKSMVTCFYCNGSLQNWGPNDNPMIEHARWFPNCAYAK